MSARLVTLLSLFVPLALIASKPAFAEACSGHITAEEALDAEDVRYNAMMKNDIAALERMLGDELVYIYSNGKIDGKKEFLETLRSGKLRFKIMQRSGETLRDYGCVSIITGTAHFEVTMDGKEIGADLSFTSQWAKRDGKLQFIGWQATRK